MQCVIGRSVKDRGYLSIGLGLMLFFGGSSLALAHDPIFGLGPHVLYKGGLEVHVGLEAEHGGRCPVRTSG